jgi:hypothetical protein
VCLNTFAGGSMQKGNEEIITVERTVPSFEKISNSINATIRYHSSLEYRVVVTTDSNLEQYVETSVKNGILNIKDKFIRIIFIPNLKFSQLIVDVYAPFLTGVSMSASGQFEAIDKIVSKTFEVNISGSGIIKGDMESDNVSINISGSGSMEGNISCKYVNIKLSSSGKFNGHIETETLSSNISGSGIINLSGISTSSNFILSSSGSVFANEFKSDNVDIRISGSGDAHIWVMENLKAHTSARGSVIYRGDPKIEFTGSGTGSIRKI